ncbi:MAG: DegQ family serine endoprotease [Nitrospiraceae bacterium]
MNRDRVVEGVSVLGIVGVGTMLALGYGNFPLSHAATPQAPTVTVAAPLVNANGFVDVAKAVTPAVVNITASARSEKTSRGGDSSDLEQWKDRMEEFFGMPFGGPNGPGGPGGPKIPRGHRGPSERPSEGMGSGIIVSSDGYILTNNHVVAGAHELTVTLPDKREYKATLVGTDDKTDLAVLKIDAQQLPSVTWGESANLQVGEYVLAVGNPFGLNSTVTLGIVSALGRGHMGITQYEEFIQTDAAINPGNSGGALVNTAGQLVGINTAIFSRSGGSEGVGFAVPTSLAKPIYESLVKSGKVVRGYLGIGIQDLNKDLAQSFGMKETKGALVSEVRDDSPADQAGVKAGDVIVRYQNTAIDDATSLQRQVTKTAVGTSATVRVMRDGREKDLTVTIGEQPDQVKTAKADTDTRDHALAGLSVQELDRKVAGELGLKAGVKGVVISDIEPDSPAGQAGLVRGDVIREINKQPVTSVKDYERVAGALKKDQSALVLINRRGATLFVSVKV